MNFASLVLRHCRDRPERRALVLPLAFDTDGVHDELAVTYGDLGERIAAFRGGLRSQGLTRGKRLLLLFPVGVDLYALTLAALAEGVAIVLVDAGMPPKTMLRAIKTSRADAIVSADALFRFRFVAHQLWFRRWYSVDSTGLFLRPLDALRGAPVHEPAADLDPADHALITFTSGSTGNPKGADRTHALLSAQHHALADHFPHADDEIDLPAFPVVVLHDLCCGITACVPPVDFRAVASAERRTILDYARRHGVTRLSGAPAYIERLVTDPLDLPTLRQLGVGGARVSRGLCARIRAATPAEGLVLYGSTEAEPIASTSIDAVLEATDPGVLVGTVAHAATVRLIQLPHGADTAGGLDAFAVARGRVGELVVSGPHVNRGYVDDPVATAENKLFPTDGSCWHRTGDLARFDDQDRLWLVGRTHDVVRTDRGVLYPFLVEEQIERRPGVVRCALVQSDSLPPTLAVHGDTAGIELPGVEVRAVDGIPLDHRHNSKVDRVTLRAMLAP